jgi:hypothetical protein
VAGSVLTYEDENEKPEVSYWIGKPYWGRGVATRALLAFLKRIKVRPLYARAAKDNLASLRVLEKCGFTRIGEDKGFANARGGDRRIYAQIRLRKQFKGFSFASSCTPNNGCAIIALPYLGKAKQSKKREIWLLRQESGCVFQRF